MDQAEAVAVMLEKYEVCVGIFHDFDWSRWASGSSSEPLALIPLAQEFILAQPDGKPRLLKAVSELSKAFALAVPNDEALRIRDDVGFFHLYEKAGHRAAAVDVALTPAGEQSPDGTGWWSTEGVAGRGVPELQERALALAPAGSKEHALLLLQRGFRADLMDALEFARNAGERRREALALAHIASHELFAWDMDACARWLPVAQAAAEAAGDHALLMTCAYTRYCRGIITGRPDIASSAIEAIFQLARRSRSLPARSLGLMCSGYLAMMRGEWEEARRFARECIELLASSGHVYKLYVAREVLIQTELHTGHLKAATACMKSAAAMGMWSDPIDPRAMVIGARITGDGSLLPPAPGPFEVPSGDGPLRMFAAWGLAWTLFDLADALVHRDGPGDPGRAVEVLDEGTALCQKPGMSPLEKLMRAARGKLVGSTGRPTGSGRRRTEPDGLSRREIDELRLVSRGFTNAEIAKRLFLSPLTVARHVHNLLDKTGMANRAEVTAWAAKHGFLET